MGFTLKPINDSAGTYYHLQKDSRGCRCPYQPPIQQIVEPKHTLAIGQPQQPQIMSLPIPCTSVCQFFDIIRTATDNSAADVHLRCGAGFLVQNIKIQPTAKEETSPKPLSISNKNER